MTESSKRSLHFSLKLPAIFSTLPLMITGGHDKGKDLESAALSPHKDLFWSYVLHCLAEICLSRSCNLHKAVTAAHNQYLVCSPPAPQRCTYKSSQQLCTYWPDCWKKIFFLLGKGIEFWLHNFSFIPVTLWKNLKWVKEFKMEKWKFRDRAQMFLGEALWKSLEIVNVN